MITGQSTYRSLLRLWWVTAVANLVSGWLITGLIMEGFLGEPWQRPGLL